MVPLDNGSRVRLSGDRLGTVTRVWSPFWFDCTDWHYDVLLDDGSDLRGVPAQHLHAVAPSPYRTPE